MIFFIFNYFTLNIYFPSCNLFLNWSWSNSTIQITFFNDNIILLFTSSEGWRAAFYPKKRVKHGEPVLSDHLLNKKRVKAKLFTRFVSLLSKWKKWNTIPTSPFLNSILLKFNFNWYWHSFTLCYCYLHW